MQRELTINLSDKTYERLMKLVGEKNASHCIETVLEPYTSEPDEDYEVTLPLNNGERKIHLRSLRLKNRADIDKFRLDMTKENADA